MDADAASRSEELGRHRTVWSEPPKRPAGRTKFQETRHPVYRGVRRRGRAGAGRWVCEVRVLGRKGSRLWLGTFADAETAARAHDSAALALSGRAACLNFADSAWRMLPVPAAASFCSGQEIKDAVAVAVAAFQRQRPFASTAPSSIQAETADEKDVVVGSPTPSALSMSSDVFESDDEPWFGGMYAGSYYASLARRREAHAEDALSGLSSLTDDDGAATEDESSSHAEGSPFELDVLGDMGWDSYYASLAQGMLMEPPAARAWREDAEYSGVEVPLWSYLFD